MAKFCPVLQSGDMVSPSEEKPKPKRAPRKRVAAKRVSGEVDKAPKKRTAKKTTAKKSPVVKRVVSAPAPEVRTPDSFNNDKRRAPTPLAARQTAAKTRKKQMFIVGAMLVVGIGASAAVGYIDAGQIDVQKTIEDRNERIRNNSANEDDVIYSKIEVPVQNTSQKVDGGLVGRGTGGAPPKPKTVPIVATTTATSTNQTASSTEAVASSTEAGTSTVETVTDGFDTTDISVDTTTDLESL